MMAAALEERKRGGCLTACLVLVLILNPLVAVYYLISASTIARSFPLQAWALPLLVLLLLANFASALGIWNWKKRGVYGLVGTTALIFLFNVATAGILTALQGLVGPAILLALLRPVWARMT